MRETIAIYGKENKLDLVGKVPILSICTFGL